MKKDTIFKDLTYNRKKFEFNSDVTEVFQDMINRSVPIYKQTLNLSVKIISELCKSNDLVYDLGCSDGALTRLLNEKIEDYPISIIGLDNSEFMINKCLEISQSELHQVKYQWGEVEKHEFNNAKVIALNFVLQFIEKDKRQAILNKIFKHIVPGGAFIFSEKIVSSSPLIQEMYNENFFEFKLEAGYSKDEIKNKQYSIQDILNPLTIEKNTDLLKQAGFTNIEIINKWNNFCTFVCLK